METSLKNDEIHEIKDMTFDISDSPATSEHQELGYDRHHARKLKLSSQANVQRLFGFGQIFAFCLTFMSTWEGMCTNMSLVLYNGGSRTFAWSTLIAYIGALAQSASLAEMASIQPISGAQYHWTYSLAPARWKRSITWMQGWVTWFGWVSLLAGVANVTANIFQALVALNDPTYVPQRWHITLIIIAMCMFEGLINQYVFWIIPWAQMLSGILHVCLFFVFMVVMVTMGSKHSAHFVFLEGSVTSGWKNEFVAWNIGMLTATWSFTGFDGAVHMSEDVRRSKQAIPRALFWSIALNGILAYAMVLVILFTMGPIDEALTYSIPIIPILHNITGSKAATTAMVSGLLIISLSVNLASISSTSRLTWAWARDGGLPSWFAYVDPKRRIPIRAVWLPVGIVCLVALLNIASTAAFGAIIALSSLGLFISYTIAIGCMIYSRFSTLHPLTLGEWNLGRWGLSINIFALIYTMWVTIFLPFPSVLPVTALSMNYAGPIFTFVLVVSASLWFLHARRHWTGPNVDVIKFVVGEE